MPHPSPEAAKLERLRREAQIAADRLRAQRTGRLDRNVLCSVEIALRRALEETEREA